MGENVHQITRSVSLSIPMILRFVYTQMQAHSNIPFLTTCQQSTWRKKNEPNANKMRKCWGRRGQQLDVLFLAPASHCLALISQFHWLLLIAALLLVTMRRPDEWLARFLNSLKCIVASAQIGRVSQRVGYYLGLFVTDAQYIRETSFSLVIWTLKNNYISIHLYIHTHTHTHTYTYILKTQGSAKILTILVVCLSFSCHCHFCFA